MKRLLKPTIFKIVLTLVLFYISGLLWRLYIISHLSDSFPFGFPVVFWESWGPCQPGQVCSAFWGWALLVDVLIWYIVSAVILTRRSIKK